MSAQNQLAGHGSPNGALTGYAGQTFVDLDTSNYFVNMDGSLSWNILVQLGVASAAFGGLVLSPTSSGGAIALGGHGNPNGALRGYVGQTYVDVDTSNYFVNMDGALMWNQLVQMSGPSAAFNGIVLSSTFAALQAPATWAVPTLLNLANYVQWGMLKPANSADLMPGQGDRFTQAMLDVTAKVRAKIGACTGFVVSATANSVPSELMSDVCWCIIGAIQSAYPGLGLSEDQKKQVSESWKVINEIKSGGDYRPSMPTDPSVGTVQNQPMAAVVRHVRRSVSERGLAGITSGYGRGDRDDQFDSERWI